MDSQVRDHLYEFGSFTLDPVCRRLTRGDGSTVELSAKPFDALLHLVRHAGETVSRQELSRVLWPRAIVEDNNLSQTILALRRALAEMEAGNELILTIPRAGYRLVVPVRERERETSVALPAPPRTQRARWIAVSCLAGAVVIGLALVIFGEGAAPSLPLHKAGTASMDAYGSRLRALAVYRTQGGIGVSVSPEARHESIRHLEDALRADPAYPAALGWLAHMQLDALLFEPVPETQWSEHSATVLDAVESRARQALAVDPELGIAHTTLARLAMYRGTFDEARQHLGHALAADAPESVVLHYGAMLYGLMGDPATALRLARRAIEADPRNPAPWSPLVMAHAARGELQAASAAARSMIDVAPTAALGYIVLARTQTHGDAAALAESRQALHIGEQFIDAQRNLLLDAALSYTRIGEPVTAARLVAAFETRTRGTHVDPALRSMAALALGQSEAALRQLQDAVAHRDTGMDPVSLHLLRTNAWNLPVLESAVWREVRAQLGQAQRAAPRVAAR